MTAHSEATPPDRPTGNRAARLARRLLLAADRSTGARQARLFALVSLAWLLLTAWGSWALARGQGATLSAATLDAVYGPFTFLTPQADYVASASLPWQFRAGRFFGAAIPVLGLYWAFSTRLFRGVAQAIVARAARGHVVVVGDASAAPLAEATARAGEAVVLLLEGDQPVTGSTAGVLLLPGPVDARTLARVRIARAGDIVAWHAKDGESLAAALRIRAAGEVPGDIVVRVDSAEMQRALRHAPALLGSESGRLRPIGPQSAVLRRTLCDAALVASAIARVQPRVHVVLHGDTPALRVAAELVLRHNWSIHLAAPHVTLADGDAPGWRNWQATTATLRAHGEAVFAGDAPQIHAMPPKAGIPVTRHLVDHGDDELTLLAGFALAARLAQEEAVPAPVQMILRGAPQIALLPRAAGLDLMDPIVLDLPMPLADLIAREDEARAARIHAAYRGGTAAPPAATGSFAAIAETYSHANRAAADHAAIKRLDAEIAQQANLAADAAEIRQARCEHARWCAERLLDGWAPGPRANRRRLHPDLVPWDSLGSEDREKDLLQVRAVEPAARAT